MIQVQGIDHVVLRCADLERMLAFYRDVCCCPLELAQPGLVQLRAGRSLVDLVPAPGAILDRNVDHLCLRVDPFDPAAIIRHLEAHGVVPGEVVRRYGADGEGDSMYIHDPEGNGVELKGGPALGSAIAG